MNITTRCENDTTKAGILYMAMELSQSKWMLGFGDGSKVRRVTIEAKDLVALDEQITKAKQKLGLSPDTEVKSCYEAGRDGFWLHRFLKRKGIHNIVLDSSALQVDRRHRRAKTDRLDVEQMLRQLIFHVRGDATLKVVRVPSEQAEDRRRMHRERERLMKEHTAHINRLRGLLNLHGIKCKGLRNWHCYLNTVKDWQGEALGSYQKAELLREVDRLDMVKQQLKALELIVLPSFLIIEEYRVNKAMFAPILHHYPQSILAIFNFF